MKTFLVKVTPHAKSNEVIEENGILRVRLNARPEGGKANLELINVLSRHFGIGNGKIKIIKGIRSRKKTVFIDC